MIQEGSKRFTLVKKQAELKDCEWRKEINEHETYHMSLVHNCGQNYLLRDFIIYFKLVTAKN